MKGSPAKSAFAIRRLAPAALLALAGLPALSLGGAQGQTASELARVQGDIRRYGCHLPQYAMSVPGCRDLNTRARSLAAQGGVAYGGGYRAYQPRLRYYEGGGSAPYYDSRAEPRGSRSLFESLFGAEPSYAPPRQRYSYPYSSVPGPFGGRQYDDEYGFPHWREATYRTLCVRLCDGYYWPISYATVRGRFGADSQQCESSCGSPAKLYVHPNPGAEVEQMVDLEGKPYAELPTAFLYRKEYVPACRCQPEPWSEEAKAEYQARETEAPQPMVEETPPEPAAPQVARDEGQYWEPRGEEPADTPSWAPPRRRAPYDTSVLEGWRGPIYFFAR